MKKPLIAITTGGTGGHVFPAISLAGEFLQDNYKVTMFLDKRAYALKDKWYKHQGINFFNISSFGLQKKNLWNIIKILFFTGIGIWQALFLLIKNRPVAVVSFGGYSSIPVVFSAIILKIPVVMHEQNAVLGKAHRLFAKYAKLLAITFNDTVNIPKNVNSVVVGMPVREEFYRVLEDYKADNSIANEQEIVLLILGGSQGAKIFTENIPKAFLLMENDTRNKFKVYHQCKEDYLHECEILWKKTNMNYIIKPFFNNMADIMLEGDLVIARAGSSTIAEINLFGIDALYIPFAKATENHQELNALNAKKYNNADIILETNFNADVLYNYILQYYNNQKEGKTQKIDNVKTNNKKINNNNTIDLQIEGNKNGRESTEKEGNYQERIAEERTTEERSIEEESIAERSLRGEESCEENRKGSKQYTNNQEEASHKERTTGYREANREESRSLFKTGSCETKKEKKEKNEIYSRGNDSKISGNNSGGRASVLLKELVEDVINK